MAVTYTYPGVYVEEIPSGVRTIAGVSTSDTAFIDFFRKGPVDRAVRITGFGDFARVFGGLDPRSESSYAIKQYYLNGGNIAWVVRVTTADASPATMTVPVDIAGGSGAVGSGAGSGAVGSGPPGSGASGIVGSVGTITFEAASPGAWGDNLQIAVDHRVPPRRDEQGNEIDDLFNLVVREVEQVNGKSRVVQFEVHRNLCLDPAHPRYVPNVLRRESSLLRCTQALSAGGRPRRTSSNVDDAIAVAGDPKAAADVTRPDGTVLQAPFVRFDGRDLQGRATVTAGSDGKQPGDPNDTSWADEDGEHAIFGEDGNGNPLPEPRGILLLERIAPFVFNLLCLPATSKLANGSQASVIQRAAAFCEDHRAFLIVDLPDAVTTQEQVVAWVDGIRHDHAAVYFPPVEVIDPLQDNRPRRVGISGTMAGVYARVDANRGPWKAAAGTDADLRGVTLLDNLTDPENGGLNPLGINALRQFPIYGNVSWGARTLEGADMNASEWKYIPVRRTALFIEESLYQGLKWVVFEPNDERLWAQIRLNVGVFMHGLFRRGAFQGRSPREAYLVKCDAETTTQADINLGVVNILVGFAPLKPAEFVVLRIQQLAGQLAA